MLTIEIPDAEYFKEDTGQFVSITGRSIQLEHSLISISKWESLWEKPFFSRKKKTDQEYLSYIKCMTINQNVDPFVYLNLSSDNLDRIKDYISKKMTATVITKRKTGSSSVGQFWTSELIYCYMFMYNIPMECEKWHINRLLTLIEVCQNENAPKEKMSKKAQRDWQRSQNELRKKQYNTKG